MFTGIVEEIGKVKEIKKNKQTVLIKISCIKIISDLKIGDSIAVNGVCLTVFEFDSQSFTADVMPETVSKTSLSLLNPGSSVNLERALTLNGRLGGHIVSGHIDGTGSILKMTEDENALWLEISANENIIKYIVMKGSVCLDGTSLTVAEVSKNSFKVSLIPLTRKMTILGVRKIGDPVNIECDILAKYIEKFITNSSLNDFNAVINGNSKEMKKDISLEFLAENGFL